MVIKSKFRNSSCAKRYTQDSDVQATPFVDLYLSFSVFQWIK
jgi:hypothetical protein